jgi:glycosyltransferase involved in cell wall biosynthesis
MKIAYLTAGAAGMFCGSCMLDNALAKQLIARGNECLLIPLYTPIRTDEGDVSIDRVFFGGVNVFLQQTLPWFKYLPNWLDAALNHPGLIRKLTAKASETSPKFLGAMTRSMLQGKEGRQRKEVVRLVRWLDSQMKPDWVVLTNLLIGGCIPELKKQLGCSVATILQGDDIFLDSLPEADRMECTRLMRKLVKQVDCFIVHSQDYGQRMSERFEIEPEKLRVVPLGINTRELTLPVKTDSPRYNNEPFAIGYLARLSAEKGLDNIVDGFIDFAKAHPNRDHVRLHIAGWLGDHQQIFWAQQQEKLSQAGLTDRWQYFGEVDRKSKASFLAGIDVLCLPTNYREPKGLSVLEGLALGKPYILPAHGAFPELHHRMLALLGTPAERECFFPGRLMPWGSDREKNIVAISSAFEAAYDHRFDKTISTPLLETVRNEIDMTTMAERFLQSLRL